LGLRPLYCEIQQKELDGVSCQPRQVPFFQITKETFISGKLGNFLYSTNDLKERGDAGVFAQASPDTT